MTKLIYTSIRTGVAAVLVLIYILWAGPDESAIKLMITLGVFSVVELIVYLVLHDMKERSLLISSAIGTGIASSLVFIYMIWFGSDGNTIKLLITLGILSLVQFAVYLVKHDIKEESSGQKDGTIAN